MPAPATPHSSTAPSRPRLEDLAVALDTVADGVIALDTEGRATFVNAAAAAMLGASTEDLLGLPHEELLDPGHASSRPQLQRARPVEDALEGRTSRGEREVARRDGTRFPVRYTARPVRRGSAVVGALVVFRDQSRERECEDALSRTERHASELAALTGRLARSNRDLEHRNRELDQFAYAASHDLKAPLRGIAHLAQWVEEDLGEGLGERGREYLRLLRGRVFRMEALIDALLRYSRAGRNRAEEASVDVHDLVDEVAAEVARFHPLIVSVGATLPVIRTDREALRTVLQQLLENAAVHGGGSATVSARATDDGWQITVADRGRGIAPRYHDRVWGIFQRLQARDRLESAGIGLPLVRKLVEARGGRTWLESEEGSGAVFHFTWPDRGGPPGS